MINQPAPVMPGYYGAQPSLGDWFSRHPQFLGSNGPQTYQNAAPQASFQNGQSFAAPPAKPFPASVMPAYNGALMGGQNMGQAMQDGFNPGGMGFGDRFGLQRRY